MCQKTPQFWFNWEMKKERLEVFLTNFIQFFLSFPGKYSFLLNNKLHKHYADKVSLEYEVQW